MKHRDGILDLVRGLSALLVMLGHLRAFILLDYGELAGAGVLTKLFYFATGLGHQAVMVFFVLSGYFVGGSVLAGLSRGGFSWRGYAAARLTRLWMVLLPALALTLACDRLGSLAAPAAYAGGMSGSFMSGPTPAQPAAHDVLTLLGNLGFLQTVCVPVFGSNGPLWSLANEFWYYVMFPLAAGVIFRPAVGRGRMVALARLSLAGGLVWWLPKPLVMGGVIWLMGAAVWWVQWKSGGGCGLAVVSCPRAEARGRWVGLLKVQRVVLRVLRGWVWRVLGGVLFLGTLAASKSGHGLGGDAVVGGAFALWMVSLTGPWHMPRWLARLGTGLSEVSYTLYVVHFPLLFLAAAVVLKGRQFGADWVGYSVFFGMALATLGAAALMWWAFERNTVKVRRWVEKGLR